MWHRSANGTKVGQTELCPLPYEKNGDENELTCDNCGFIFGRADETDQCPDCGKHMVRPANEAEQEEFAARMAELVQSERSEAPRIPELWDAEISMLSSFSFRLPATALQINSRMVVDVIVEYGENPADRSELAGNVWARQEGGMTSSFLMSIHLPAKQGETPKEQVNRIFATLNNDSKGKKGEAPAAPSDKDKQGEAPTAAIEGPSGTSITQIFEKRLSPPDEASRKSLPTPKEGESYFITLHPAYLEKSVFNNFSVDTESENFKELLKSVELVGIKDPVLARFSSEGKLEILSGQRRHIAATMLNYGVPTIIQKIDDADAKIIVADGNLHRDKISSYDLSRALRMKMEGMKQKAGRRKKGYAERQGLEVINLAH